METNDETKNANEHNTAKNRNWQEVDQLAIYKRARGVELDLPRNNSNLVVRAGLEPAPSRFQVQRPNHLTTKSNQSRTNSCFFKDYSKVLPFIELTFLL